MANAPDGKGRKRKAVKSTRRQDGKKHKTTINLSPESYIRLNVHALMTGKSNSELIEEWILQNCTRFRISDHGGDQPETPEKKGD